MLSQNTLRAIGPGLLVAATGVGAGDLAAASFTGSKLGLAVLWAVLVGAFLKFVLNEGLTRWQLATGTTLLEGAVVHLGRPALWLFLAYLVAWSFLVGAALISAIGVTSHAIYPLLGNDVESAQADKIIYGVCHSLLAVALIWLGGFRIFEKFMGLLVGLMFVIVVLTAATLRPPLGEVMQGLLIPTVPVGGVAWTVALMGGIGGTVTVLSYGYWIREIGRRTMSDLPGCRVDLAAAYVMTAVFGVSMVIIGDSLPSMEGSGARLMVVIAEQLEMTLGTAGPVAKWAFLIGAWAAVFTSLFGVWQSTPYLFADLWRLMRVGANETLTNGVHGPAIERRAWPYQVYLGALATVPTIGVVAVNFQAMMKVYAVVGALFIPMLAAVLLYLNGRSRWIGQESKNTWRTNAVLIGALALFVAAAALEIRENWFAAR